MSAMASLITSLTIVYSTVYSRRRSKKTSKLHRASLAFVLGIHRWPVNSQRTQRASNAENISIWWCHHATEEMLVSCTCGKHACIRLPGRWLLTVWPTIATPACLHWKELILLWSLRGLSKWVDYRKTSTISRTLVGNKVVDNSDVVGASPVGAAPTTSSLST